MTFDQIKASSQVFIDANIFVDHFCGFSRECADLLLRCEREEVIGLTSAGVQL
jgi:predicted nucleic acid-binding protein